MWRNLIHISDRYLYGFLPETYFGIEQSLVYTYIYTYRAPAHPYEEAMKHGKRQRKMVQTYCHELIPGT